MNKHPILLISEQPHIHYAYYQRAFLKRKFIDGGSYYHIDTSLVRDAEQSLNHRIDAFEMLSSEVDAIRSFMRKENSSSRNTQLFLELPDCSELNRLLAALIENNYDDALKLYLKFHEKAMSDLLNKLKTDYPASVKGYMPPLLMVPRFLQILIQQSGLRNVVWFEDYGAWIDYLAFKASGINGGGMLATLTKNRETKALTKIDELFPKDKTSIIIVGNDHAPSYSSHFKENNYSFSHVFISKNKKPDWVVPLL